LLAAFFLLPKKKAPGGTDPPGTLGLRKESFDRRQA
jgi:hypothetical protein